MKDFKFKFMGMWDICFSQENGVSVLNHKGIALKDSKKRISRERFKFLMDYYKNLKEMSDIVFLYDFISSLEFNIARIQFAIEDLDEHLSEMNSSVSELISAEYSDDNIIKNLSYDGCEFVLKVNDKDFKFKPIIPADFMNISGEITSSLYNDILFMTVVVLITQADLCALHVVDLCDENLTSWVESIECGDVSIDLRYDLHSYKGKLYKMFGRSSITAGFNDENNIILLDWRSNIIKEPEWHKNTNLIDIKADEDEQLRYFKVMYEIIRASGFEFDVFSKVMENQEFIENINKELSLNIAVQGKCEHKDKTKIKLCDYDYACDEIVIETESNSYRVSAACAHNLSEVAHSIMLRTIAIVSMFNIMETGVDLGVNPDYFISFNL